MVNPAIVSEADVLLASAQVPPLLARVMVTTAPLAVAVAEQSTNPVGKVMVGVAGTVNAELKVTVMVLPEARAPLEEVVKPTVHVATAPAVWGEPENVTGVGLAAADIVTPLPGLAAAVSSEVFTLNVVLG